MKVIVAGVAKTGTKSMCAALRQLNYTVYDYMEHFNEHKDDWSKIWKDGGTTEDFKRMYKNVDAVTDVPAALFWDEIHKAFPDAKIILLMRDNEDDWYKSLKYHLDKYFGDPNVKFLTLSPSHARFHSHFQLFMPLYVGYYFKVNAFAPSKCNEMLMKMAYRRHNANVLQNAPKDKFLVFNVKQGWEPLCKFLQVEVPTNPFPRINIRGEYAQEHQADPMMLKMVKEAKISMCLILLVLTYGGYKLAKKTPTSWIEFGSRMFQTIGHHLKF